MPIATIFMIAVIALVIIGGIVLGKSLLGGGDLTNAQQEVAQIVSGVQSLYATQVGFPNLTTAVVVQSNIAPTDLENTSNNTISDPYGGAVHVDTYSGATNAFDVELEGLGNSACTKLATSVNAYEVLVNGTDETTTVNQPVSPSSAASACNAGSGQNTVEFVETQSAS